MEFQRIEHWAVLAGLVLTVLGILKALVAWREARDEGVSSRAVQQASLAKMMLQFENNHGSSLLDKVEEGNRQTVAVREILNLHVETADSYWDKNDKAHEDLHRRIEEVHRRVDEAWKVFGDRRELEHHRHDDTKAS